ncbi:hypothetical protein [Shimazuella alba]|uniref:Uncharacterized protein n=1 Tax=Shimazuella alba TaxID=2690964 RepID=A0A6I4W3U6_9BACL|nr:hypothetical protein [Shimazuella alba]MXQ55454.1 hypothetical protein [Shimazuella alba]
MELHKKQIVMTPLLRKVFLFDAVGTGVFALVLIFFANFTGEITGITNTMMIRLIGIGSIIPASFSFWAASRIRLQKIFILLFAIVCTIWVIGSFILILLLPFPVMGVLSMVCVAICVGIVGGFLFYFYFRN